MNISYRIFNTPILPQQYNKKQTASNPYLSDSFVPSFKAKEEAYDFGKKLDEALSDEYTKITKQEIINCCKNKDGKLDKELSEFVISALKIKGILIQDMPNLINMVKNKDGNLNKNLDKKFKLIAKEITDYFLTEEILEVMLNKNNVFNEDSYKFLKKLRNEKGIDPIDGLHIVASCKNEKGNLNKKAEKMFEKVNEIADDYESIPLIFDIINDTENNSIYKDRLKDLTYLIKDEKWSSSNAVKIFRSFINDDKRLNKNDYKAYSDVINLAKANKTLMKTAVDDISDSSLEEYFWGNTMGVTECLKLAGEKGFIEAFKLKFDGFQDFVYSMTNLYEGLKEKEQTAEFVIRKTNPEKSNKYKNAVLTIEKYKKIIDDSKTPEQRNAEKENNKKIKLIEQEISVLKQKLDTPSQNTAQIKKEIKVKNMQLKDLQYRNKLIINENDNPVVKNAVRIIKENQAVIKKLKEESLKDPKDIIEKLSILYAMRPNLSATGLITFLRKMDTQTPEKKEKFQDFVTKKLYEHLDTPINDDVSKKLNLQKSKYLPNLFMTNDDDFKSYFKDIVELLIRYPNKSTKEIFDTLEQNIETKKLFEERGINYEKWVTTDKNSFVPVTVKTNLEKAKQAAIKNLESDLNDPALKIIPKEHREGLFWAIKEKGFEFKEQKEIIYDDEAINTGVNNVSRLFKGRQPVGFSDLHILINAIKEEFNANNFWTTTNDDDKIDNAKNTFMNHILKLRENEYKTASKMKNDETVYLEVHKTDMNDISHALFLGNHASCCTAIGTGVNEFSAPSYIKNKCISSIEVVDRNNFVGNTMCYIAEVDGKTSLVLDNIELNTKYQFNDKIRDAIFEYAKKLCNEIGQPQIPIYAGPYRHKVNMDNLEFKHHDIKIIGSTGNDELYIDYLTDASTISPDDTEEYIELYKIR